MKSIFRIIFAIVAISLVACKEPDYGSIPDTTITSLGTPNNNEIWFTTVDGRELFSLNRGAFNVEIENIDYSEYGVCAIRFKGALTTIGSNAFSGCHNLFNISLPNSVKEIGERAFYDCFNMESLTIGDGLSHCKSMAFNGCYSLHSLHIPAIYNWCKITFDSPDSNPLYYACRLFVNKVRIETLNIPDGIESISSYAFYNNSAITEVNIPASLKSVGSNAFSGCDYIEKVIVRSVKRWSEIKFENEEANPLSIAEKLYLKQIVEEKETTTEVRNIELKDVANIGPYVFINCHSIESFTSDNALTAIGLDAFRNCTSLTNVFLGEGISEIGKHGFMGCKALNSFTCLAQQPPQLGNDYVFEYNNEERKFYVPSAAVDAYKSNEKWSKYADSIEPFDI